MQTAGRRQRRLPFLADDDILDDRFIDPDQPHRTDLKSSGQTIGRPTRF